MWGTTWWPAPTAFCGRTPRWPRAKTDRPKRAETCTSSVSPRVVFPSKQHMVSFEMNIVLVPQQSPGRCKSPTWRSLSTRLRVLTSRLITTSETLQVSTSSSSSSSPTSSFFSYAADDQWCSTMCLTDVNRLFCRSVPWSRRHKGWRAISKKKQLWSCRFFFFVCLDDSFSLQTQEQPLLFFFLLFMFCCFYLCTMQIPVDVFVLENQIELLQVY